ncbi:hypothetical protein [Methanosarcina sp. DH2]|nr:hypothetical protein [Methanosarcina sp. DH2]
MERKGRVLPRRNSGETQFGRDAIRARRNSGEAQFGRDRNARNFFYK